jgi:fatty-acyl-CoA synthase
VRSKLTDAAKVWYAGGGDKLRVDDELAGFGGDRLKSAERPEVTVSDCALLIFTSGTTGMPKAAKVSHRRILSWAGWFAGLMDARPDDRLYDCLPLFHSRIRSFCVSNLRLRPQRLSR